MPIGQLNMLVARDWPLPDMAQLESADLERLATLLFQAATMRIDPDPAHRDKYNWNAVEEAIRSEVRRRGVSEDEFSETCIRILFIVVAEGPQYERSILDVLVLLTDPPTQPKGK